MLYFLKRNKFSNLRSAALAAIIIGYSPSVSAQTTLADNWYIGGFGGVVVFGNEPIEPYFYAPNALPGSSVEIGYNMDFRPGYVAGVVAGLTFVPQWRGELELSMKQNDFFANYDYIDIGTATTFDNKLVGNISNISLLANVWYDFDVGTEFRPYIGGGLGIGLVSLQIDGSSTNDGVESNLALSTNQIDSGLAFQIGTGVRTMVAENVYLDLGYRFSGISGLDFKVIQTSSTEFSDSAINLFTHTFQIGLTYKFK